MCDKNLWTYRVWKFQRNIFKILRRFWIFRHEKFSSKNKQPEKENACAIEQGCQKSPPSEYSGQKFHYSNACHDLNNWLTIWILDYPIIQIPAVSKEPHCLISGRMLLLLHNANILLRVKHPGVTCKPVSMCQVIYGTDPQHFIDFGFVSPEENSCHSTSNLVLCVQPPAVTNASVTKPPVVVTVKPVQITAVTQDPKPVQVTQAPVPVTQAPILVTQAPIPIQVTQAPIPVTQAPIPVTESPHNHVQVPQIVPVLPSEQGFPTLAQGVSGQPPYPYYNNVQVIICFLRTFVNDVIHAIVPWLVNNK